MINRQRIRALMRKDWRELARNKQAVAPLVIIPLLFAVIIPTAVIVLGNNAVLASSITGLRGFLDNLPDRVIPADPSGGKDEALKVAFKIASEKAAQARQGAPGARAK